MRTVTYLTRRNAPRRGALSRVGNALLARSRWASPADLPLVRWATLTHPRLPGPFHGLRIAQIADVHAGAFMPPDRLARVRDLVTQLEPDLIVFTGDQLDRREVDAESFVHGFAGLEAPIGMFGVLGNHDHLAGSALALAAMEAVGITPLVNDAVMVDREDASLTIAGVDDLDALPPAAPDFRAVHRFPGQFRLLLCHQPNGWPQARLAGAEITLAGHTHGGQITIPSRGLNVARLRTPFVAGPYWRRDQLLYVSRGVGVGAVPLRFGSLPEVDLITLQHGPIGGVSV